MSVDGRESPAVEPGWEAGWDVHRRAQVRRLADSSFLEKLEHLAEMQRLAEHLLAAWRARRDSQGAVDPATP